MMTGIIWKVDELPTPEKKNSAMKPAKNSAKLPPFSPCRMTRTDPIMPRNTPKVTRPPPTRSASQPLPARLSAPISGPRKAYCSALTPGKASLVSIGKAAE